MTDTMTTWTLEFMIDDEELPQVELTPEVGIVSVQPDREYRINMTSSGHLKVDIDSILAGFKAHPHQGHWFSGSTYVGYIPREGSLQFITIGHSGDFFLPKKHEEGMRYLIVVPYELEEPMLKELRAVLEQRRGAKTVSDMVPWELLQVLAYGKPELRYFSPSIIQRPQLWPF